MRLHFLTYNVNYSTRAVGAYAKYGWENRSRNDVYKVINSDDPIVVFLQEVLTSNREEVQTNLSEWEWHFEPINSRNGVCCNAIGIKSFFLPEIERKKFTYNFNQWEQSAEKVLGLIIGDICFLNVHFPMVEKGRFFMAQNLDKCLPNDKDYRVILAGDFNSFPDCRGEEQLEIIQKVTRTVRISDNARSEVTGEIARRSFMPYPYDAIPEAALNMPGKLDHIFVKGFQAIESKVLDALKVEGENFSPSDHSPLKAILE